MQFVGGPSWDCGQEGRLLMVVPKRTRPNDEIRSEIDIKILDLLDDYMLWMVLGQLSDILCAASKVMTHQGMDEDASTMRDFANRLAILAKDAFKKNT